MEPLAARQANPSCSDHFPKLFVLIVNVCNYDNENFSGLPYSAPEERGPGPVDGGLARPGALTQPAVVGEGACSIALSQITFRLIPLSRSDAVPGLVHLRQRFVRCGQRRL